MVMSSNLSEMREDPRIYTMEAGYDSGHDSRGSRPKAGSQNVDSGHDLGGGDPEARSGFRTSEGGSRVSAVALARKFVENRRK
jgi:hypothetical protein